MITNGFEPLLNNNKHITTIKKILTLIAAIAIMTVLSSCNGNSNDKMDFYATATLSDATPGYAGYCELNENPDQEEGELRDWGALYVNPDEHKPGFYDFVFTYGGKTFAVMLTKFYDEKELESKPNAELDKMMEELSKK